MITGNGIDVSQAKPDEDSGCPILFDESITLNFPNVTDEQVDRFTVFPESNSSMRFFRVSHADIKNPFELEIIGAYLQCSVGLVDVFLQETRGMTAIYQECVRGRVNTGFRGAMQCVFRCLPTSTGKATFVRFAKANHVAADYGQWTLNDIIMKDNVDTE